MKKAILTLLMIPAFVGMLFSCSEVKTNFFLTKIVVLLRNIKYYGLILYAQS